MSRAVNFTLGFSVSSLRGGPYSLDGTTQVVGSPDNTPARRRVRLHEQLSGQALMEQWSDAATGAYQFNNIRAGTYFVVAFDHTGAYSGVVETDIVVPAP